MACSWKSATVTSSAAIFRASASARSTLRENAPTVVLMLAMPFPYIANEAGWTVAEVGRQPWLVYGLQRTADGISMNVSAGMTWFTLLGFMGLYLLIGLLYLLLFLRIVWAGAGDGHTGGAYGATVTLLPRPGGGTIARFALPED